MNYTIRMVPIAEFRRIYHYQKPQGPLRGQEFQAVPLPGFHQQNWRKLQLLEMMVS